MLIVKDIYCVIHVVLVIMLDWGLVCVYCCLSCNVMLLKIDVFECVCGTASPMCA